MKLNEFLEKAILKHGNNYDYSLIITPNVYSHDWVGVVCSKHGIFNQRLTNHLQGHGCPKCAKLKLNNNTESFIIKSKELHGDKYDYNKVKYNNNLKKVIIICHNHGEFLQKPILHLNNHGCPKCGEESRVNKSRKTTYEFIFDAQLKHGDKYDYSLSNYKANDKKIIIICPKHGKFLQKPNSHLTGNGCPKCNESRGESKIRVFLEKNNINYIPQKKFDNCKDKHRLKFDFYLPDVNTCIEYDGEGHYFKFFFEFNDDGLNARKLRDKIKTNFCLDNNITLLRISYNEDIDKILKEKIK